MKPSTPRDDDSISLARLLRSHHRGVLLVQHDHQSAVEHAVIPIDARWVLAPGGELVLMTPVGEKGDLGAPAGMDRGRLDALLCAPNEAPDAVQVSISLSTTDEDALGHLADRFRGYHVVMNGRWFKASVQSVKHGSRVADADELELVNAVAAPVAAAARKLLNADPGALARLCRLTLGIDVASPLAVGVDQFGIDVRTTFGIVRLDFASRCTTDAEAAARAMLERCRDA